VITERMGRVLSAVGAVLLGGGLFVTWYHIQRGPGLVEPATGWETFIRLRVLILLGALILLGTAIVIQTRPVIVVRTLIGVVLGLLILRRVVFPPALADPVESQIGVFVGLLGALAAVLGGLVDTGREVVGRYPEMAFWRPPAGEIGTDRGAGAMRRNGRRPPADHTVDSTAEEL